MKQLLVFAFLCISAFAFGQTTKDIKFNELEHSFGKIKQGKPVTYIFTFKNNASKPVIIEKAEAECGCTTPEYPKSPVMKTKSGTIKVTYNAANMGAFTKKVTVRFANVKDPVILTIKGEVVAATK